VPEEHFSVEMPAALSETEAEQAYQQISDEMAKAYSLSRDPVALNYPRWRRFNRVAYPSGTHGARFVNIYGNAFARPLYNQIEIGQAMPESTILAKDSFAVTDDGRAFAGPLFVMEKMAAGFDPEARDWRYSMIMPDGSYYGVTGGENANKVQFCITCHQTAGDENDHLFFIAEDLRVSD